MLIFFVFVFACPLPFIIGFVVGIFGTRRGPLDYPVHEAAPMTLPFAAFLTFAYHTSSSGPIKTLEEAIFLFGVFEAVGVCYMAVTITSLLSGDAVSRFIKHKTGFYLCFSRGYSMMPSYSIFSLCLVKTVNASTASTLRPGDVICYISRTDEIVHHRIIKKDAKKGVLYTKGDNNDFVDLPVRYNQVRSKDVKELSLHYVGLFLFGLYWACVRLYRKVKFGEALFVKMHPYYIYFMPEPAFFEADLAEREILRNL